VTGLPTGAGDGTGEHLPAGAFHVPNDARLALVLGGAPPPGDARHRYVIVVQVIGIEKVGQLQMQGDSTPAWLGFSINLSGHLLGRTVITPGRSSRPRGALRCSRWWAWEDLNLRPLPYQGSALTV
jgi:hypothetical protein